MEWKFKRLTKDDTLQNASHLEFFHTEALHSAVDALAREDIQNRLDALAPDQSRVEVRYRLCGPVAAGLNDEWFAGLESHLASPQVKEELGVQPSISRPLHWLAIEDFQTTGLEGDPLRHQDPVAGLAQRNDFFWFIRNVGRSGKKGGDRGRWGLGKIVYPAASQVRSFFAYTVRRSNLSRLLIGRSVLAVHHVSGHQHESEGYFGRFDDSKFVYFATPEDEPGVLDRFASRFNLTRKPDQPGLSLVIPWPDPEITTQALICSIIEHWFWVILEDRLVVHVTLAATGESIAISRETVEVVVRKCLGETTTQGQRLLRKLEFASDVQQMDRQETIQLSLCPANLAPKWDCAEERFSSPEVMESVRLRFQEGKILSFNIPVRVARKDSSSNSIASFEVYLRQTHDGTQAEETFLRDGLTISGQHFLREPGLLAIVKAGDDSLGTLLGDAENPAHTRWERGGKHFRGRYEHGPSILIYVQRAAQRLCALLSQRPEGIDENVLRHLFSLPESGTPKSTGPKPKTGPKTPLIIPTLNPPNFFVECKQVSRGFHVRPHPKASRPPTGLQIRAAYEVVRGNPFKLHHPADFDLSKQQGVVLDLSGLTVESATPNRLILAVHKPDFYLTAIGFDPSRDLIVEVRPLNEKEGDNIEPDHHIDEGPL